MVYPKDWNLQDLHFKEYEEDNDHDWHEFIPWSVSSPATPETSKCIHNIFQ
ncbi:MAG TPA: hypothetical protein VFT78_03750 [Hanamia sp.]|nr:hypothetical protein [Hanamia sp.]